MAVKCSACCIAMMFYTLVPACLGRVVACFVESGASNCVYGWLPCATSGGHLSDLHCHSQLLFFQI